MKRVSIGTVMEFGWADGARKPIILVMDDVDNIHDHPMVRDVTGWRVNNLDAGLRIIEHILMPEGKGTAREIEVPRPQGHGVWTTAIPLIPAAKLVG
jgi:hypothetical protein